MQRDYIMRMIERFMQALVSIITSRKAEQYDDAYQQILRASQKYLQTDLASLINSEPEELVERFKEDNDRGIICADLLYELGKICEEKGEEKAAKHMKKLSQSLYKAIIPKDKYFQTKEYLEKLEDSLQSHSD